MQWAADSCIYCSLFWFIAPEVEYVPLCTVTKTVCVSVCEKMWEINIYESLYWQCYKKEHIFAMLHKPVDLCSEWLSLLLQWISVCRYNCGLFVE